MDEETYQILNIAWEAHIKVKTRAHNSEDQALLENILGLDATLEEVNAGLEKSKISLPPNFKYFDSLRQHETIKVKTKTFVAKPYN